jgi:hypothetical protein
MLYSIQYMSLVAFLLTYSLHIKPISCVLKQGPAGILGLMKGLTMKDLAPETPAIANYTTGEVCMHAHCTLYTILCTGLCTADSLWLLQAHCVHAPSCTCALASVFAT